MQFVQQQVPIVHHFVCTESSRARTTAIAELTSVADAPDGRPDGRSIGNSAATAQRNFLAQRCSKIVVQCTRHCINNSPSLFEF